MDSEEIELELLEVNCPVCESENTKITQKILDIPHFPDMWLFSLICNDCHYKHNDFINLSVKEPVKYIYHLENKDDYTTKVIRSSNGTISFPKIEATIEPGPSADGFINNVEGILRDIQGKVKFLLNDATDDEEIQRIVEYIKLLDDYIDNCLPIDIVIEDPFGNSSIIPADSSKLETIYLTENEASKLKTGLIFFEDLKE